MSHTTTDHHQEADKRVLLGFWLYLMTDCVLFGCLFAAYACLHANTYGGVSGADVFKAPYVLVQTLALLTSSFTCGLGLLAMHRGHISRLLTMLRLTFILGLLFVTMEGYEFSQLVGEGHGWQQSGFLTSFFTLVATHGTHISIGLLWIAVMMAQIHYKGLSRHVIRRLECCGLFWHFLDVVWIFIFTFVYLEGLMA